jgi:Ca-activated chloride channel family protein
VAANRTPPSGPISSAPSTDTPRVAGDPGGFKVKVDIDLTVVEATVRDQDGGIVDSLKRENFHLFEDGVEQQITHFSLDELPLAAALVVDRSGSMAPVINELRRAAYDTLSLLKPDDLVGLFAFSFRPERLEYLTTDRKLIADDIAEIHAGGGTNIADALFDAALYLGHAAQGRRHAVILVSDNENTVPGHASDGEVIRLALETETVIYSIKVGEGSFSRRFNLSLPALGGVSVPKIARQTGGEIIDANSLESVQSAMATVISRLKQRYSLGYYSTNRRRDGTFRKINVRVTDSPGGPKAQYTVYARQGYYARTEHVASRSSQP